MIETIKNKLSASVNTQKKELSKDELIQLFSRYGSWTEISRQLNISMSTLQRLRRKFDLHVIQGQNKLM